MIAITPLIHFALEGHSWWLVTMQKATKNSIGMETCGTMAQRSGVTCPDSTSRFSQISQLLLALMRCQSAILAYLARNTSTQLLFRARSTSKLIHYHTCSSSII